MGRADHDADPSARSGMPSAAPLAGNLAYGPETTDRSKNAEQDGCKSTIGLHASHSKASAWSPAASPTLALGLPALRSWSSGWQAGGEVPPQLKVLRHRGAEPHTLLAICILNGSRHSVDDAVTRLDTLWHNDHQRGWCHLELLAWLLAGRHCDPDARAIGPLEGQRAARLDSRRHLHPELRLRLQTVAHGLPSFATLWQLQQNATVRALRGNLVATFPILGHRHLHIAGPQREGFHPEVSPVAALDNLGFRSVHVLAPGQRKVRCKQRVTRKLIKAILELFSVQADHL